jgi:hypothetical protein
MQSAQIITAGRSEHGTHMLRMCVRVSCAFCQGWMVVCVRVRACVLSGLLDTLVDKGLESGERSFQL